MIGISDSIFGKILLVVCPQDSEDLTNWDQRSQTRAMLPASTPSKYGFQNLLFIPYFDVPFS